MPLPRVTLDRLPIWLQAASPIFFRPPGSVSVSMLSQWVKALDSMVVTVAGIVSSGRL